MRFVVDIWVEDNDIESAIKALRRQSRDVLYKRRHRLLRGPKPSDKRRNKLWFAYRSRNVARAAEARCRAAERQRTLIAAWEDALERRRSGPGRA
jgi:ribosomal protein S21